MKFLQFDYKKELYKKFGTPAEVVAVCVRDGCSYSGEAEEFYRVELLNRLNGGQFEEWKKWLEYVDRSIGVNGVKFLDLVGVLSFEELEALAGVDIDPTNEEHRKRVEENLKPLVVGLQYALSWLRWEEVDAIADQLSREQFGDLVGCVYNY